MSQRLMCQCLYDLGGRREEHGSKTLKERKPIQVCVSEPAPVQMAATQSHKNSEDPYEMRPLEERKCKEFIHRLLVKCGP